MALADDAYDALARLKKSGQSFSDVVRELTAGRKPRLREVLPPKPTPQEDIYWKSYQTERRQARRRSTTRVRL